MPHTTRRMSLAIAMGLVLVLPAGMSAQTESTAEESGGALPTLEGLGWYRSLDLSGTEIQETLSADEVVEWAKLVDGAGATFEQLGYTFDAVVDPTQLPDLGGIATVRVDGADTATLRAAVVQDVLDQVGVLSVPAPEPVETTISGKDVVLLDLPDAMTGEDAMIYASGDTAWVILLPTDQAAAALQQLP
jgi:hypothetical protein